jgi:hypothetical protein
VAVTSAVATSAASDAGALHRPLVLVVGATVLASSITGCGDTVVPGRAPDVTGMVSEAGSPAGPVLADPSDDYFEGMSLVRGDPVVVRGGEEVVVADLRDGDAVEVWIGDGCAESFPVQCTVVAVRVTRTA